MSDLDFNEMIPADRQNRLLEYIRHHKAVNIKQYSKVNYIHEATVRRDLTALEKTGLVKRNYGGAVLNEWPDSEIPLFVRDTANRDKKELIGQKAALRVHDGDTLILDSSSTTLRMIPHLAGKKNLKIITNGAKTAIMLTSLDCKIYCTGGSLRENSLSFIGSSAISYLKNFNVDAAFFSCRALSQEKGLTDNNEDEALLRRVMIEQSRHSYLLIDSTKLNKTSFFSIDSAAAVTEIISDTAFTDTLI